MQMQVEQPQPESRPPIKMADTPDYIALHIADLLRMRARGKTNSEMLLWLRTHGVDAILGDVAAFWQDYDTKQKEQQQQPESAANKGENGPPVSIPVRHSPTGGDGSLGGDGSALPPVLWEYAFELVALRGIGKTDDELLAWLRTRKNLGVNATEIANVLDYYEKYQEELDEDLELAMLHDPKKERGQTQDHDPEEDQEQHQDEAGPPSQNASGGITVGDAEKPKPSKEEKYPPNSPCGTPACEPPPKNASGGVTANTANFDISGLMANYKILVDRQVEEDKAAKKTDPERQRTTQGMVRTMVMYRLSLERREERLEALKIKKAESERKAEKAETHPEAAAQNKAPKDFDNTALIQKLRYAGFWDVDALLASGLVDEEILEAKRKAKAAGAEVEEYVPPPLGTGLWSKPAPSSASEPGIPSAQAASSSGIPSGIAHAAATDPSGIAQGATTEAPSASHPSTVKARMGAFLSVLAQLEAASPSGIPSPAVLAKVIAASHTSSHLPTNPSGIPSAVAPTTAETSATPDPSGIAIATPDPLPEKSVPIIGSSVPSPTAQPSPLWGEGDRRSDEVCPNSPFSQHPSKPGPTNAGTPPAINPSG